MDYFKTHKWGHLVLFIPLLICRISQKKWRDYNPTITSLNGVAAYNLYGKAGEILSKLYDETFLQMV
jgi:hypothetical protein